MARHISLIIIVAIVVLFILSFTSSFKKRWDDVPQTWYPPPVKGEGKAERPKDETAYSKVSGLEIPSSLLTGGVIAPKLENATVKAELGRASWKLLHTMMARFPEKPTEDDSLALKSYIQLFSRLYPCGDCARHFQGLLKKFPPQVSSRNAAAGWACFVHNEVNKRLKKPEFDCTKIGDFYDCGCGDDDKKKSGGGELKLE